MDAIATISNNNKQQSILNTPRGQALQIIQEQNNKEPTSTTPILNQFESLI